MPEAGITGHGRCHALIGDRLPEESLAHIQVHFSSNVSQSFCITLDGGDFYLSLKHFATVMIGRRELEKGINREEIYELTGLNVLK